MNILNFEKQHIKEAKEIAIANYYEEKQFVRELPQAQHFPDLSSFAENGLGVAAFENEKMIGYLCCYNPWENAFGSTAKGSFSPIHAHGAVPENREIIYKKLYQAAAEKWVANKITYHAIALYAHDKQALNTFFMSGFGMRCVDSIRSTKSIECSQVDNLIIREIPIEEIAQVRDMYKMMSEHLRNSPCFMYSGEQEYQSWIARRIENQNSKIFVAELDSEPVSFIAIDDGGENFISDTENMKNICAAFCLPKYRGTGVFQNLLNYVIGQLKLQDIQKLGVDYESFNPTASGAWSKYFVPYTNIVVRRIDECALND